MINPVGSPQLPSTLFGGLVSEFAPATLVEGLSPDNQDVAFSPGNVFTRPALGRMFPTGYGQIGVTYNKAFIQPNGLPLNLQYTSDGLMHVSNPLASPPTASSIFQGVSGTYASSTTAFGRECITVHDGYDGQDIPRSFDGTNVRRITMDGPGAPISASDAETTTIPIDNIVPLPPVDILTASNNAGVVTIVTAAPHGLTVNVQALITGVSEAAGPDDTGSEYNGVETVATVPTPSSFTYNVAGQGWNEGTGGQVIPCQVTVTTTEVNDLISGETIVVSLNSDQNYNNSTGATPVVDAVSVSGIQCQFFPHSTSVGVGVFGFTSSAPGPAPDIYFGSVPAPTATFASSGTETLMFNPYPNAVSGANDVWTSAGNQFNDSPMEIFSVNADGSSGGGTPIWSGATRDYNMISTFNLQFPAAGTYTLRITNADGVTFGMGGGAVLVSAPNNLSSFFNPSNGVLPPTITAGMGYPIFGAQQGSAYYHANTDYGCFDWEVTVSIPAAGVYPAELDYARWYHGGQTLTMTWVNTGVEPQTYNVMLTTASYATPATWTVDTVINSTTFTFNAIYAVGIGIGGIITIGGLVAPGTRSAVCFWQTDTGFLSKPSAPFSWNAAGNKRVSVDTLPIGPSNVIARWVAFTGANGGSYFAIPVPAIDPSTGQTVSTSTVVNDNTSTSATFDFSDNTLFEGLAIDITGNDLFSMTTLGTPSGVFSYSNRLVVWGDTNKIQNLWNMGFEGGVPAVDNVTEPGGWDVSANQGGQLVAGRSNIGLAWQITGNGTGSPRGMISQPAFQDWENIAILNPQTQFTYKCLAYTNEANASGDLIAQFFSPTQGVIATATIACSSAGVGENSASFVSANFSVQTPAVIPSDAKFQVYTLGLGNGQAIVVDEQMLVYTAQPTVPGQARLSYANNPEAFDAVTGFIGLEYSETLLSCNIIRDNLYIQTDGHLVRTQDNGVGEPITWTTYTVAEQMKGLSTRCFDVGEGWGMIACESGLYAFSGGEPQKISQEIQNLWMSMNTALWQHVWVRNDVSTKRIYIGVPLATYTPTDTTFMPQSCNKIFVLDYRELNTASMIENAPPIHIALTGHMLSSDLTRKWTVWNLPMNCADFCFVGTDPQMTFGSGFGNGLTTGFGNSYMLAQDGQDFSQRTKFTDDDYGTIGSWNGQSSLTYKEWVTKGMTGTWRPQASYYVTYFSPSHDQEQAQQITSNRKLYEYLQAYVTGVGNFYVLPLMDRVGNSSKRPPKARCLNVFQNYDLEWPLNVRANRLALLFYAMPSRKPIT
jgi:hypothetical protein